MQASHDSRRRHGASHRGFATGADGPSRLPYRLLPRAPRSFCVQAAWLSAGLALLLYGPIVFGKVPFPADIVLAHPAWDGMSRPNVTAHAEMGDLATLTYPWKVLAARVAREEGSLALWNPHVLLGLPWLANSHSGLLYPPTVLFYLLAAPLAWALTFPLRTAIAAFTAALLCHGFGASRAGALAGGLVFALCGFLTTWQGWPSSDTAAWIPALLVCLRFAVARPGRLTMAAVGASTALALLAGHAQTALLGLAAAVVLSLWTAGRRRRLRPVRGLACAFTGLLLGGLIAAAQLVPELGWVSQLTRDLRTTSTNVLPAGGWATFLYRDTRANPNYLGLEVPEGAAYAGVLTLVLAALAVALRWRRAQWVFPVFLVGTGVSVAFGFSPALSLYRALPLFGGLPPNRSLLLADLGLAMLAAQGITAAQALARSARRPRLFLFAVGCIALIPLWLASVALLLRAVETGQPGALWYRHGAVATLLLAAAASAWLAAVFSGRLTPRAVAASALALLAADLVTAAHGHVPFVAARWLYPDSPPYRFLAAHERGWRSAAVDDAAPANTEVMLGLHSPFGYSYVSRDTARLLSPLTNDGPDAWVLGSLRSRPLVESEDRLMDLLSVRFFLFAPQGNDDSLVQRMERLYPTVFRHGRLRVLENPRALPRLFLVPASGVLRVSREEAWAHIRSQAFDPAQMVLLEETPAWPTSLEAPPGAHAHVESLFSGSNSVEAYVFSPGKAVLVATDTWAPGWTVLLDGARARLLRVNACLRGVAVGPGGHHVRFEYRPAFLRLGLALSALGMLVCLALAVGARRWS